MSDVTTQPTSPRAATEPSPDADGAIDAVTPEPPRERWWLARRALIAGAGVIVISAAATVAIARNEVSRLTEALEQNKPVRVGSHLLAPTSRGAPETLLLVGNDERAPPRTNPGGAVLPHSNEMLLVRIDPRRPTITMLSIPRELRVPIDKPDGQVEANRINSAFTYGWENGGGTAGGVKLMLETIKRVLGVTVNHVFVTNFHKFAKAVNAMGCVYMTVDKRYYHVNEPGGEQYFEIDLQPGYQKLCGLEALEFVANRHESTSLIRDARDQRFLLETKAEYGSSLFSHREKFERIFGKFVESTLAGEGEIVQLLYLLAESAGKPVRQIDFHVTLGPTFDTASTAQIHEAVSAFMGGTTAIAAHPLHAPSRAARAHRPRHSASAGRHSSAARSSAPVLTPTSAAELAQARTQAPELPFPLEYPRDRNSYASAGEDELRLYRIHDLHGRLHPIYDIVISRGELGQYYDVQGTNWDHPPMLGSPGQTVRLGSRTYEIYYVGEQVKTVCWREAGATYWIENTLTDDVSPHTMLAIAERTLPVISSAAAATAQRTVVPTAGVRLTPGSAHAVGSATQIGTLLGLLGLAIVAALAPFVLARQRQVTRLRETVAQALALESSQRALLASISRYDTSHDVLSATDPGGSGEDPGPPSAH